MRPAIPTFALLGALLVGCGGSSGPADGVAPPAVGDGPTTSVAPGDGGDTTEPPASPGPAIGVPADACRLLEAASIARVAGAASATGKASTQGPFRSCEYTVRTQDGASGQLFLDVTDQRPAQLYDVATTGVQVSELSVGGLKASYDPASGKVYVLTAKAFFSVQLPTGIGTLTSQDGLRAAATELASQVVVRIGG